MNVPAPVRRAIRSAQRGVNLTTLGLGSGLPIGTQRYKARPLYVNQLSLRNTHERWMDQPYGAALRSKQGTFIDVGANIGQTLLKVLALEPDRPYVGFEPQLGCAFYIDDFIRTSGLTNHQLFPIGLSNRTGFLELFRRMTDDGMASSTAGFRSEDFYRLAEHIYVARGDDAIGELGLDGVGVIKVDVEGGELEVVEGLHDTIAAHLPFVFFEALNHALVQSLEAPDEATKAFRDERCARLEEQLRGHGHHIFALRLGHEPTEVVRIDLHAPASVGSSDYVAVPAGLVDRFRAELAARPTA